MKACAFSAFVLAHLPCDDRIGGEVCVTVFNFLVVFHKELSVEAVGVRPCRNV
jgi:hypothetical protein